MNQNFTSLKSYCKAHKVKQPKEPYPYKFYLLQRYRDEILTFLHRRIDQGGGSIGVVFPMDESNGRLFSESGQYYFTTDKLGRCDLNALSTDFLGEQLYYAVEESSSGRRTSFYENRFDDIKGLVEEWMHVFIANKEKRVSFDEGVALEFAGGYVPGEMSPGMITAVYEKDGEYYVCIEGQDDVYYYDLNIDTMVVLGDKLYEGLLSQVTPRTCEEALTMMALECKDESARTTLASDAKTSVDMLTLLSEDKQEDVRCGVARNVNTPVEILSKLADDPSTNVRQRVASNPNTPVSKLIQLADAKEIVIDFGRERDLCKYIRMEVARNPQTPAELLAKLADDSSETVRKAVSERLALSSSQSSVLSREEGKKPERVQDSAEPENNLSAEQLAKMALDPDYRVRREAAKNPNTPVDFLVKLAFDVDADVLGVILQNPRVPLGTLIGIAHHDGRDMGNVVKNPVLPLQTLLEFAVVACYYPKKYPAGKVILALLNRI